MIVNQIALNNVTTIPVHDHECGRVIVRTLASS